jgi:tripartite-type tricarboxylate transporter receptor subunit TctC
MRRSFKAAAVVGLAAISLLHSLPSSAQSYPTKRITLIVPLPAGASSDGIARIYAEKLKDRLGQPVIVENRVGNGGVIGTDAIAKSAPDGYTIGVMSQVIVTPRGLLQNASFDGSKDFTFFGRVSSSPFVIVAPGETGVKTLGEFVALAKSKPGALNYGVVPNSLMQIDMVRFMQANQVKIQEVPFNGAAPIANALLSNQVQMSFVGTSGFPHFKTGKLVPLAVTSRTRWSLAPEIPTTIEQGLNFESSFWYGFGGPAALPADVTGRLVRDISEVSKLAEVKDLVKKLSMDPLDPSPAEMLEHTRREREQGAAVAKSLGIAL